MKLFKPIFIVGVGRSGTSMLQSMLNAHNKVTFPPETHFIRSYVSKNKKLRNIKKYILKDINLLKLNISLEPIISKSIDLKSFYFELLTTYMRKKNKKMVGDKDPKNIEYLKLIHSIFPNAIIIHIYRDPRAVIASRLEAKWSKDNPFWQHILAYKAQLTYGRNTGKELFSDYIEIKYEDLLKDPNYELQKLCESIGLDFDPNMIEFYKSSEDVVRGEELSWKKNIFNPIMINNIFKWKKVLSKQQVKTIEFLLGSEMKTLGYEKIELITKLYILKKQFYKFFLAMINIIYTAKLN